jgi:hypothetical protein
MTVKGFLGKCKDITMIVQLKIIIKNANDITILANIFDTQAPTLCLSPYCLIN